MTDDQYIEAEFASIRREVKAVGEACETAFTSMQANMQRELGQRDIHWRETITSLQRAVDKAEGEMRQKLSIMNEFRSSLDDQQKLFARQADMDPMRVRVEQLATRTEIETRFSARDALLEQMRTRIQNAPSREEMDRGFSAVGDTLATQEKHLGTLEAWKNNMQGRMWAIPLGMGVVVFVITQLMRVFFPEAK